MLTTLDLVNALAIAALAAAGLALLLVKEGARTEAPGGVDRLRLRLARWAVLLRLDWKTITIAAGVVYALALGSAFASGISPCPSGQGPSDLATYLASGRAFLTGGNPFTVMTCGALIPVPYGIAAVLVNAVGSLGGEVGIAAVWGGVALAVLPLTWWVAGPDRRYVTLVVATSVLFLPLATGQIDGASNLLLPVAVLATLALARRGAPMAAAVGGFLSTGRFPGLFPILGASGSTRKPFRSALAAVATFGGVTVATYAVYGSAFARPVFLDQVARRSFSLNAYGVLLHQGWLPSSPTVAALQAAGTLALIAVVAWRARTPLGAATITLTGLALLSQFLSFNILGWLLPVAIVGTRPRWWLWAIGIVGTVDYDLGYLYWGSALGVWWPYEVMDVVLTVLLLQLFVELWRTERSAGAAASDLAASSATTA